jgi:hypothetical protein
MVFLCAYKYYTLISKQGFYKIKIYFSSNMFMFNTHAIYYFYVDHYNV